ncbi:phosphatidylserine decarboxylase-domain-containing protein [Delphinella strobiligena]|nr:phosphatidylserine decarboxylase-domain-containing protein [Delphinella strobiligena]
MPRPRITQHLSIQRFKHNNGSSTSLNQSQATSRATSPNRMAMEKGDHKGMNLVLRVEVIKGRNLAPKDKSGTSDPYLVITIGDSRQATSVVPKTLNPEWNQTFDLPVVGVDSLLLEAVCWDKDRFGKDYMGEFDVAIEDIFASGQIVQEPQWYKLHSKKTGKKKSAASGEILLRFSIFDPINSTATPQQILQKFYGIVALEPTEADDDLDDLNRTITQDLDDEEDDDDDQDPSDESERRPEQIAKRKKRHRLARLKRKTKLKAYEFNGLSDIAVTRTSFDMDPFVVTSLGKKTYRTRVVRHNLNPVFEEKLVFQVLRHETNYSLNFTVVDRDKLSGNDFVGTANFALQTAVAVQPEADPDTGLYNCPDPPEAGTSPVPEYRRSRFKLSSSRSTSTNNMRSSRNTSSTNLNRLSRTTSNSTTSLPAPRPPLKSETSGDSLNMDDLHYQLPSRTTSNPQDRPIPTLQPTSDEAEDPDLRYYAIPLTLKHKERWEDKHNPTLHVLAKYMPYQALRQQFWRAMLKHYDADDSGKLDKVELTTMLDTLGSTLHESTINSFFVRFAHDNGGEDILTMDQAVICLEDRLQHYQAKTLGDTIRGHLPHNWTSKFTTANGDGDDSPGSITPSQLSSPNGTPLNNQSETSIVPALEISDLSKEGEEGEQLPSDDLADEEKGEEHVIEIHECPICHQPRLDKKNSEADIITHVATCASQDWRAVNNIVMGGFVTSSQAQRKWYSKVITKIGYGGYKLGANSANILVQDRITGQINEERMSVYVRLGIRLLYKGLKSNSMEKKRIRKLLRSLSFKQGRKYDDPASAAQITGFVNFHQLDMSEVLRPISEFKTFNEFFYRQLKPTARPCSAPERPDVITSPADCRSVVFNRLEDAQRIWVKGREFSVERLLGNAYPEDAKRYVNGSLGIFRLAPQDYHRFHIPVDGVMGEPKVIEGEYYTVNPMAIRSALDVYGENTKVVVPIDSVKHGRVMVICVGAMMVGSTVITRNAGDKVARAEELGYFKFGGSTLLLLFEPGKMVFDSDMVDNSNGALETLIRVGMSIGHSPDHAPHTPDMRKENPSMAEKQDAKRRIEGSFAPSRDMPEAANMQ